MNYTASLILLCLPLYTTSAQLNLAIIKHTKSTISIHETKSKTSRVIGHIEKNEIFQFKRSNSWMWEVQKEYDTEGRSVNLIGFIPRYYIKPVYALPDQELRKLLIEILEQELNAISSNNFTEKNNHNSAKFEIVLTILTRQITYQKDEELLRKFISILKYTENTSMRALDSFGKIYLSHSEWTIDQMKNVGISARIIDKLDLGFEQSVTKSDNYAVLKNQIISLKMMNQ